MSLSAPIDYSINTKDGDCPRGGGAMVDHVWIQSYNVWLMHWTTSDSSKWMIVFNAPSRKCVKFHVDVVVNKMWNQDTNIPKRSNLLIQSVILMQNGNELCCARALITNKWESFKNGRKIRKGQPLLLHHEAMVPFTPCSYHGYEFTHFGLATSLFTRSYRWMPTELNWSFSTSKVITMWSPVTCVHIVSHPVAPVDTTDVTWNENVARLQSDWLDFTEAWRVKSDPALPDVWSWFFWRYQTQTLRWWWWTSSPYCTSRLFICRSYTTPGTPHSQSCCGRKKGWWQTLQIQRGTLHSSGYTRRLKIAPAESTSSFTITFLFCLNAKDENWSFLFVQAVCKNKWSNPSWRDGSSVKSTQIVWDAKTYEVHTLPH